MVIYNRQYLLALTMDDRIETTQALPEYALKDALVRLSVSPIKADREAITRIEKETGKDIQAIIRDLDSIDTALKAIDESPIHYKKQWFGRMTRAFFFASLVGLIALFFLPSERIYIAIVLGFVLGVSLPSTRR